MEEGGRGGRTRDAVGVPGHATADDEEDSDAGTSSPTPTPTPTLLLLRPAPTIESLLDEFFSFESAQLASETCFRPPRGRGAAEAGTTYLNHGSFGDPYPSALRLRRHLTDLCYRQPMVYHRSLVPALVERSRERVCDYLGIGGPTGEAATTTRAGQGRGRGLGRGTADVGPSNGFVFCNVTAALFAVLQSISFDPATTTTTTTIVTSDMLYHSLVDVLGYLSHRHGGALRWVQVETPPGAKSDDIYHAFETVLLGEAEDGGGGGRPRKRTIAIFDHVSSKPSIVFPVQRICRLCRMLGIPTLVDGAHGPGCVPAGWLRNVGCRPTFYAMTFHKWCNTPRGGASGGLYVDLRQFGILGRFDDGDNDVDDEDDNDVGDEGGDGGGAGGTSSKLGGDACSTNFQDIFDLSRLTLHHGDWDRADTSATVTAAVVPSMGSNPLSSSSGEEDADAGTATTATTPRAATAALTTGLYLDHTTKPGFFTDHLTQGIYDESTREYENIIVLKHCLDLVERFEGDFQRHVGALRRASRDVLQAWWKLTDAEADLWYGDDVHGEVHGGDGDGDGGSSMFSSSSAPTPCRRGWELGMLSIPLPTEDLVAAMRFPAGAPRRSSGWTRAEKLRWLKGALVLTLWTDYSVEVPLFVWRIDRTLGVRISFGRYVRIEDVDRLGAAVADLVQRGVPVPQQHWECGGNGLGGT